MASITAENFSDIGSRIGEENEVAAQPADRHRPQDRRTRRTQGGLRQNRRALQLDAARARAGKVADARPHRHAGRIARGLRDPAHRILSDREKGDRDRGGGRETARRPRTGARVEPRAGKHAASNSPAKSPRVARADHRARASAGAGKRRSAARSAKATARCRTSSTPPKSASSSSKASLPPRAKSWRCSRTKSVRYRSQSTRRSTRPPASPAG